MILIFDENPNREIVPFEANIVLYSFFKTQIEY